MLTNMTVLILLQYIEYIYIYIYKQVITLYPLNTHTVLYVNYISIRLEVKENKNSLPSESKGIFFFFFELHYLF